MVNKTMSNLQKVTRVSNLKEATTISNSDVLLVETATETLKVTKENLLKEIDQQLNTKSDLNHTHSEYMTESSLNNKGLATETFVTNKITQEIEKTNAQLSKVESQLFNNHIDITSMKSEDDLDYTMAFSRAMELLEGKGGRIFVPQGTFFVEQIVMVSNVEIYGVGSSSVITQKNVEEKDMIILKDENQYKCKLTNLKLDGNKANQTTDNSIIKFDNQGVEIPYLIDHYHEVNSCVIENAKGDGVSFNGCREVFLNNLLVRKCNNGVYLNVSHDNKISNCTVSECSTGYHTVNSSTLRFVSCKSFYCGIGLKSDGGANSSYTSIETQSNELHGYVFLNTNNTNCVNVVSDSNGRLDKTGVGLLLDGCTNLSFNGVVRSQWEGSEKCLIEIKNTLKNVKVDVQCLIKNEKTIKLLETNGIANASVSVKINDIEIYNNNIVTNEVINSIADGKFSFFDKKEKVGITSTFSNNGVTQKINIESNDVSGMAEVGLVTHSIALKKGRKVSCSALFSGYQTNMFGKITVNFYNGDTWISAVGTDFNAIGKPNSSSLLVLEDVVIPDGINSIKVVFSNIVQNNHTGEFTITEPRIMIV